MSELNFVQFFTDVHGYPPLPWQERLATKLTNDHTWPDLIDLPTASGKTACIDIAVFHLAWCAAQGQPWLAARRIVFVVDRRIIVDAAADRAEMLRSNLEDPPTESIGRVAAALKRLGGSYPVVCERLRGGMPRERGIALNPAQPMIITSTVDQVGSRLLFRGYGISPYSYPLHAGLLGFDTLLLVDEAHLSQPFMDTVAAICERQQQAQPPGSVQPLSLVPLSATARTGRNRFQLDTQDLANKYLRERHTAPKPARLVDTVAKFSDRVKTLASEALTLVASLDSSAPAIAVVVNRVRTARALYDMLFEARIAGRFDIELMIGRSRPLDRDGVAKRVVERVGATRSSVREKALIVIATQTIEVGADLDFQGLVTECAALDALRQRFGRVDRLGKFRRAQAVIVGGGDDANDAVYGPALSRTWSWLSDVAALHEGARVVDFSIESMERLTRGQDLSALASPVRNQITLTPLHIDLLCQTSPAPMYSPDVPALLHGPGAGSPDVQVVWRADLPLDADESLLDASRLGVAAALLDRNPPTSLESMSLPLASVRAWLMGGAKDEAELADIEGVSVAESDEDAKNSRWVLRRLHGRWGRALARDIRPGDTIVAPSVFGGCDEFGFAPASTLAVRDLSASARAALRKSAVVVISPQWLEQLGIDVEGVRQIWRKLSEDWEQQVPPQEVLANLLESVDLMLPQEMQWLRSRPVVDLVANPDGSLFALVLTEGRVHLGDISDEDISSSRTVPVELHEHNAGVARHARSLAQALSLEPQHVEHLALAGQLHDVGKADPRFQQMLRSGDSNVLPGSLLAKGLRSSSSNRMESAERHEAYSVGLVDKNPGLIDGAKDHELVRYLIGTHHGRGRALMPDRSDEGTSFAIEMGEKTYSFDGVPALGSLQAGWSSMFWRLNQRYGPWGLAYLESVLRLADWLRSAEELEQEQSR